MLPSLHAPIDDPTFSDAAKAITFLCLDFDGVMTDNLVYVFEDGREAVRCSRFEGFGLRRVERAGVEPFILSTEANPVVSMRAEKLKVRCIQNIDDKVLAASALLKERGIGWDKAAFVGNDLNDRALLELVALPIVVADAHESLDDIRAFRTSRLGGYGAVRQVCDAIARAKGY